MAHRGDMTAYPENSLMAFRAAAELGFSYMELDIQLSKDLVPIVIHDENLVRTTGVNKSVCQTSFEEICTYKVLMPSQHNVSDNLLKIARLKDVVELLNIHSNATLFVEIKRESIDKFDLQTVVEATIDDLQHAKFNVVIISFLREVIEYVQDMGIYLTGWALKDYDEAHHSLAKTMQAEYLFCNIKKVKNPSQLWNGPWKWVLYDVKNPKYAYELLEQGVDLIETGDIVRLHSSNYFQ